MISNVRFIGITRTKRINDVILKMFFFFDETDGFSNKRWFLHCAIKPRVINLSRRFFYFPLNYLNRNYKFKLKIYRFQQQWEKKLSLEKTFHITFHFSFVSEFVSFRFCFSSLYFRCQSSMIFVSLIFIQLIDTFLV